MLVDALDLLKLKAFADVAHILVIFPVKVENTGGKGEGAVYQHYLLSCIVSKLSPTAQLVALWT